MRPRSLECDEKRNSRKLDIVHLAMTTDVGSYRDPGIGWPIICGSFSSVFLLFVCKGPHRLSGRKESEFSVCCANGRTHPKSIANGLWFFLEGKNSGTERWCTTQQFLFRSVSNPLIFVIALVIFLQCIFPNRPLQIYTRKWVYFVKDHYSYRIQRLSFRHRGPSSPGCLSPFSLPRMVPLLCRGCKINS